MAKRKTDEQLRAKISLHSETARELLRQSHEVHKQALAAESTAEHVQTTHRAIELQRLAIKETKTVQYLEKILLIRQIKTVTNQRAVFLQQHEINLTTKISFV